MGKTYKIHKINNRDGYVALITAIIVSAVVTMIGLSLTLTSIDHGQTSLSKNDSLQADQVTSSCLNDLLIRYYLEKPISDTIVLPIGSCSVSSVTDAGSVTYTITYDTNGYSKVIEAVILTDGSNKIYIKEK